MSVAVCLIALALGYKVFADASKEKEGIRLLGQIIGIVVMVLALISTACATMKCAYKAGCPMMSKFRCSMSSSCPMSAKANYPVTTDSSSK